MNFNESPIEGTKGYIIDLVTHEVFNTDGKKMKPFVDSRGRVSIKLRLDEGNKQRVFIVKDIIRKINVSSSEIKENPVICDHALLMMNVDKIVSYPRGLKRYKFTKELLPELDNQVIKKFLSYLK